MTDAPWLEKLRAARAAALASLTPEEAAARVADDAAKRQARSARRASASAVALLVNQRIALGDKPDEIGASLGVKVSTLRGRASRWGHALVQRAGFRRLSAWVADRHVRALDDLAAKAGLSREKALGAILEAALADGAVIARRVLAPVKSERAAA